MDEVSDGKYCKKIRVEPPPAAAVVHRPPRTFTATPVDPCADPKSSECEIALSDAMSRRDWKLVTAFGRARCGMGDSSGCQALVSVFENGAAESNVATEVLGAHRRQCDSGEADACVALGLWHENGVGVETDPAEATRWFTKACHAGNLQSCAIVGMRLLTGPSPDVPRGRALLQKACDGDRALACERLAADFEERGDKSNAARAFETAARACQLDKTTCGTLGGMYYSGFGVRRDVKKSDKHYADACEAGEPGSCTVRAAGGGYSPNKWYERAADLYAADCDAGSQYQCARLGELYARGSSTPSGASGSRARRASDLMADSCRAGVAAACRNLGYMHQDGAEGFAPDLANARQYFRVACDDKDEIACEWLRELGPRGGRWGTRPLGESLLLGIELSTIGGDGTGGTAAPVFMLTGQDRRYGKSGPFSGRFSFQSSFTRWLPIGMAVRGSLGVWSWPRADRSAISLVNFSVELGVGGAYTGVEGDEFRGWAEANIVETAMWGCRSTLMLSAGYQVLEDRRRGMAFTIAVGSMFGRWMTGRFHDRCESRHSLYDNRTSPR